MREDASPSDMQRAAGILKKGYKAHPNEIRFPLYLAEAYYRMADPDGNVKKYFPLYKEADAYALKALKMDPNRPEAHYWHGLFLLKKAQNSGIFGAFSNVKKGIKELDRVREAMPDYDHGGAARVLGMLYCRAPGWTPFGDVDKSVQLAKEAASIDPDYLQNRLSLAQSYDKQGDKKAAIREYRKVVDMCSKKGVEGKGVLTQARNKLESLERSTG